VLSDLPQLLAFILVMLVWGMASEALRDICRRPRVWGDPAHEHGAWSKQLRQRCSSGSTNASSSRVSSSSGVGALASMRRS
jgi:hypothetical protein